MELLNSLFASPLAVAEWLGIVFSLFYVLLVARQIIWCWPCNFLGATLAGVVFYASGLYLLVLLQLYYCGVAVYGWLSWRRRGPADEDAPVQSLSARRRLALAGCIAGLACVSLLVATALGLAPGWVLVAEHLSTWIAVFAMVLAARRFLENWMLWAVANVLYIAIFLKSELYGFTGLNTLFLAMSFYGWWQWARIRRAAAQG